MDVTQPSQVDLQGPLQLIDFEYSAPSFRGFDLGNHFNEYAGDAQALARVFVLSVCLCGCPYVCVCVRCASVCAHASVCMHAVCMRMCTAGSQEQQVHSGAPCP